MFRLWAKIFSENRMLNDVVIINDNSKMTRTKKVLAALDEACVRFDLQTPIWLDANISEFKKIDKTRFNRDNFIESIDFDFLEIQVIEEDDI